MDNKREIRSTRGKRITALEGEEAENDKLFWGNEVWNEVESEDESFGDVDILDEPDEFDSDFNDSEDTGDSDEEDAETSHRKSTKKDEVSSIDNR